MTRLVCTYPGPYEAKIVSEITQRFGVSALFARALIRRGLTEPDRIAAFLSPETQTLSDPFLLPDMRSAKARIERAIFDRERICVYGDYDADGVIATAIVMRYLKSRTENVRAYIPSRHDEGYGMNADAVDALHRDGVSLIVTVDNGISAFDEIALCNSLGIDVVITDHHLLQGRIPSCCAVVSAARPDSAYPFRELCGAGVAMQLVRALSEQEADENTMALAAIATIADVVPLLSENRMIAAKGLPLVPGQRGFSALMRAAGLTEKHVDSVSAAYTIAPRLNAAGRMGDARDALALLLSDDDQECVRYAAVLDAANRDRRNEESRVFAEAHRTIGAKALFLRGAILVYGENWNKGVLGIAASRITEMYHRPSIVFSLDPNGVLNGSGRSISGVDLFEALSVFQDRFLRFGGHAGAAGVTMQVAYFAAFQEDFCRWLEKTYPPETFEKQCVYEEAVSLDTFDRATVLELMRLSPFGAANPEPIFLLNGVSLRACRAIGKGGQHFSAELVQANTAMRMVAFGFGASAERLSDGTRQDVLATVSLHSFLGKESIELTACEISPHDPSILKFYDAIQNEILYNIQRVSVCSAVLPHLQQNDHIFAAGDYAADEMRYRYRRLKSLLARDGISLFTMFDRFSLAMLLSLFVFWELGFFRLSENGNRLELVEKPAVQPLEKSGIYRCLTACDASKG